MNKHKILWKSPTGMYQSGKIGKVGKWVFFKVIYDGMLSKDNLSKYKLVCFLPGINSYLGHYKTEKEAFLKATHACDVWFKGLDK